MFHSEIMIVMIAEFKSVSTRGPDNFDLFRFAH